MPTHLRSIFLGRGTGAAEPWRPRGPSPPGVCSSLSRVSHRGRQAGTFLVLVPPLFPGMPGQELATAPSQERASLPPYLHSRVQPGAQTSCISVSPVCPSQRGHPLGQPPQTQDGAGAREGHRTRSSRGQTPHRPAGPWSLGSGLCCLLVPRSPPHPPSTTSSVWGQWSNPQAIRGPQA